MSVATKNPFDLLGNDDGDSDTPAAPVKTVDKTSTHTVKRNTDGLAPAKQAPPARGGSRRGGIGGNEGAFRDRNAGSDRNRAKTTDESVPRDAPRGGRDARVRGGRGGRFPRERDDRHAKNNTATTTEKAASQGWGANEGEAELKDEQAGEEMAQAEKKEAAMEDAEAPDAEPEQKTMSLQVYMAQQAEKKLALQTEGSLKPRQANEGSKDDKKWAHAKPLAKENDEDYFAGTGGKAKRERERKTKQFVEIDNRYVEPERPRGGRGRGEGGRGGRGDGAPRGDGGRGRGRGGSRGDFGSSRGDRADRGDRGSRGGRGANPTLKIEDTDAFPSLGR